MSLTNFHPCTKCGYVIFGLENLCNRCVKALHRDWNKDKKSIHPNHRLPDEYKSYWKPPALITSDYIGLPMGDNIHANLKEINKRITELSFERTIAIGSRYI